MSSIDQRIVEMQLKNEGFEKGIKQSLKSLKELQKGLDLEKSAKSVDNLQKAGNNFSLDKMGKAVEGIANKFTLLGRIGVQALDRIANSVIDTGVRLTKSLSVDQVSSGMSKYQQKMASVQTIMNATGDSIDAVNGYLDKLMWFSDETSYNFTEMTAALGTLTSSGGKVEKLIPMIEGMATATAFAGKTSSEFSRVIYNLNQSYSQGYLSLMDWKSVELAQVGSEQLKQTLIDTAVELGKLKKDAKGTTKTLKGTVVTAGNMGSTLNEKWATREVMEAGFGKFASVMEEAYKLVEAGKFETASDAIASLSGQFDDVYYKAAKAAQEAKSFTEAIDATKDAVSSGWMKSFELIFGNKEESTELWTDLANALWDIFASSGDARNNMLQLWKDAGGRDDLIQGIIDALYGLHGIVLAVKEAFKDFFPELTADHLINFSKSVKEFGQNLRKAFSYRDVLVGVDVIDNSVEQVHEKFEDLNGELKKGAKGEDVKKLQQRLMALGYSVGPAGDDGIFGPKTLEGLKKFQEAYGLTVDGIYDSEVHGKLESATNDFLNLGANVGEFTGELKKGAKGEDVKKLQEHLTKLGYDVGPAGPDGIFGAKTQAALEKFQKEYGLTVNGIYNSDVHEKLKEAFSTNEIDTASRYALTFGSVLKKVKDLALGFFSILKGFVTILGFLKNVALLVFDAFSPLINVVFEFAAAIGRCFSNMGKAVQESAVFTTALEKIKAFLAPIKEFISGISQSILNFFGLGEAVDGASAKIQTFGDWWTVIKNNVKNSAVWATVTEGFEKLKRAFSVISEPIKDWIANLKEWWKTSKDTLGEKFTSFLSGSANVIISIANAIGKGINAILGWITPFIEKIPEYLSKMGTFLTDLFGGKKDKEIDKRVSAVKKSVKKAADSVGEFWEEAIDPLGDVGDKVEEVSRKTITLGDVWNVIKGVAKGVFDVFKFGVRVFGFFLNIAMMIGKAVAPLITTIWNLGVAFGNCLKNLGKSMVESEFFKNSLAGIKNFFETIGEFFNGIGKSIRDFFGVGDTFSETTDKIQTFAQWWTTIKNNIKDSAAWKAVTDSLNKLKAAFESITKPIGDWFKTLFGGSDKKKSKDGDDGLKNKLNALKESLGAGFSDFLQKSAEGISKAITWILNAFSTFVGWITTFISNVPRYIERIKSFFSGIVASITGSDFVQKAWNGVKDFFTSIWNWIKGLFSNDDADEAVAAAESSEEKLTLIERIANAITSVWNSVKTVAVNVFNGIKNFFVNTVEKIAGSEFFKTAISGIKNFFGKIGSFFASLYSSIKGSKTIQKALSGIKNFFSSIWTLIKSLFSSKSDDPEKAEADSKKKLEALKTIEPIWLAIKNTASNIFLGIKNFFATAIEKIKDSGFIQKAWNGIKEFFGKIGAFFSNFFAKLRDTHFFENAWNGVKGFFSSVWTWIKGLFSGRDGSNESSSAIESAESSQKNLTVFQRTLGRISSAWESVKKAIGKVFSSIKGFFASKSSKEDNADVSDNVEKKIGILGIFESIGNFFKKNAGRMLAVGGHIAIGVLVAKAVKSINSIIDNIALLSGKKKEEKKSEGIGNTLLKIAGSLAILVGAVWLLGSMKPSKLKQGALAFAGIIGGIMLFIVSAAILNRLKMGEALSNAAKGLFQLGIGIAAVSAAIWILGKMKDDTFVKGGLDFIGILTALFLFCKFVGNVDISLEGFEGLAKAMLMMSGVILILGKMKDDTLNKGTISLFGMLLMLFLFIKGIGNTKVSLEGMKSLGKCVRSLAITVQLLGAMKDDNLIKGIMGLSAIMLALFLFVLGMSKINSGLDFKSMAGLFTVVMSISVLTMALGYSLKQVKNVPTDNMLIFVAGLSAILLGLGIVAKLAENMSFSSLIGLMLNIISLAALVAAMGYALKQTKGVSTDSILLLVGGLEAVMITLGVLMAIGKFTGIKGAGAVLLGLVGLVGVMLALSYALSKIKGVDSATISSFCSGLSKAVLALSASMLVLSMMSPVGILTGALGLIAIVGVIGLIIAAFAGLSKIKGFNEFMSGGAASIGKMVGSFQGAMEAAKLDQLGKGLSSLSGSDVNQKNVDNALAAAKSVANFASGFPSISITEAIANKIAGGTPFAVFCDNMTTFASSIGKLQEGTKGLTPELKTQTDIAVGAATSIADFANGFPQITITQAIADAIAGDTPFGKFCGNIPTFAESMKSAAESLNNFSEVNSTNIGYAVVAATGIRDLANGLNNISLGQALIDAIVGDSAFGKFCNAIPKFAESMNTAAHELNIFTEETRKESIDNAVAAATGIRDLANGLNGITLAEAVLNAISGDNAFSQFCNAIPKFATSMSDAAVSLNGFGKTNTADVEQAVAAATGIRDLSNGLNGISITESVLGLLGKKSSFATFCDDITNFKDSITTFQNGLSGIANTTIEADTQTALSAASQIATFVGELSGEKYDIEANKGAIDAWFTGDTKANTVIDQIAQLGEAIGGAGGLQEKIKNLADTTIESDTTTLASVLKTIADALGGINENVNLDGGGMSTVEFETKIEKFLSQINTLGGSISSFNSSISNIDEVKTNGVMNAVSSLGQAVAAVSTVPDTSNFDKMLDSLKDFFNGEWVKNTGNPKIDTSGVVKVATECLKAVSGYKSRFQIVGADMARGMANGLKNNAWIVRSAAKKVAQDALDAAKKTIDSNSPSKKFEELGMYSDQGFAIGLSKYSKVVSDASKNVATTMLDSARGGLSTLNSIVSDSMDDDPVVRPVIDLSDVQSGAKTINGMFGNRATITAKASVENAAATANSIAKAKEIQNVSKASSGTASVTNTDSSVNVNGTFYVRSDQDIRSLASEIAALTKQQQRSFGAGY